MFAFGAWVENFQQAARDVCSDYIRWFQTYELMKDMTQFVLNVDHRLHEWERLLSQLFDALVRREWHYKEEASALFTVTQLHLKGRLEARLYRAARNRGVLISFGSQPDPQMHGYQADLRRQSATGLADELLNRSRWECDLTPEGMPTITLVVDSPDLIEHRYSTPNIRALPQEMYQLFHKRIEERLGNTDVFDYLIWLREHKDIQPATVANRLDAEATTLINAGGVPERRTLVYREPTGNNKKDLADHIALKLGTLEGIERSASDRNAITLIKTKKPNLD